MAEVFTPQVVVDGRDQTAAVKADEIDTLVQSAKHALMDPPQMFWRGARVGIGGGRWLRGGLAVRLVRYDLRLIDVQVKDGDNRGHRQRTQRRRRADPHRLRRGRPMMLTLPLATTTGLKTLVSRATTAGAILGMLPWEPAKR